MSESQQGPEICDVISRKRFFKDVTQYYYIVKFSPVVINNIEISQIHFIFLVSASAE